MPSESESVSHFSLGLLLVAGGLQLVLQVESLVAVDELVGDGVPHRPAFYFSLAQFLFLFSTLHERMADHGIRPYSTVFQKSAKN